MNIQSPARKSQAQEFKYTEDREGTLPTLNRAQAAVDAGLSDARMPPGAAPV
jgi:hypothetical protein